ncbi:DUF262 domain-containing protein [Lysobacter antibioticus]|uniref:DUF262 domain-containing protein n=1 Tax=Lysobacter antibioticus TaxID=84531 RepID=UPI00094E707E|nr:DUF262 domain-containing protein [Lysobacter antibioticus]
MVNAEDKDQEPEERSQLIPDSQQEDEDDLGKVSFQDTVVTNADWTIESINLQIRKGNIDLLPSFQRRSAWDHVRKSRLIESIIVGMPVPNVVLAENREHRGRFIVIDGKQRLISIQDFLDNKYPLRGLDLRSDLNGKTFEALDNADKERLENSTLRSTLIRNWKDENFLYAAFYRLNAGSLPLSPQELRKALIGGNLIDAIEGYLEKSQSFHSVFGAQLDKRMRDSELVLRFIAFDRSLETYRGDFKKFLDDTTRHYEQDWNQSQIEVGERFARLDLALATASNIFGEYVFRKWLGSRYERVINRAIFDCLVRYFADEAVAKNAAANNGKVIEAFQRVCGDNAFKNAIEKSTKTQEATNNRLSIWGQALAEQLDMAFDPTTFRIN